MLRSLESSLGIEYLKPRDPTQSPRASEREDILLNAFLFHLDILEAIYQQANQTSWSIRWDLPPGSKLRCYLLGQEIGVIVDLDLPNLQLIYCTKWRTWKDPALSNELLPTERLNVAPAKFVIKVNPTMWIRHKTSFLNSVGWVNILWQRLILQHFKCRKGTSPATVLPCHRPQRCAAWLQPQPPSSNLIDSRPEMVNSYN